MTDFPFPMAKEHDRACDVLQDLNPTATWWRGDFRSSDRPLVSGGVFNLVDDSNPNDHRLIGQFRAVTITAAPEGYIAVIAVQSVAVPSQVPTVVRSQVIKERMTHHAGVMGQIVPAGEGLEYTA